MSLTSKTVCVARPSCRTGSDVLLEAGEMRVCGARWTDL